MSDAAPPRAWRFYVEDMVTFIDKALAYMNGIDRASFRIDTMRYDATLRNIEMTGEAATHLPDDIRKTAPDVPWRLVIAVRNRLIHGYLGVNDDTLWSILRDDLPPLRGALLQLLAQRPE